VAQATADGAERTARAGAEQGRIRQAHAAEGVHTVAGFGLRLAFAVGAGATFDRISHRRTLQRGQSTHPAKPREPRPRLAADALPVRTHRAFPGDAPLARAAHGAAVEEPDVDLLAGVFARDVGQGHRDRRAGDAAHGRAEVELV